MDIEYYEELDQTTIENLWEQGVTMDDWDYVLITTAVDNFYEEEEEDYYISSDSWYPYNKTPVTRTVLLPKSYTFSRLLTGCDTMWYRIQWKGRPAIIGVAYH